MTLFVAGLTILGSRGRAKEGRRALDEKHRHQIPTSSSDARLCIMQRVDSLGHTVSAAYFTRCNGSHYSHNSQNFLKFFPLRIIEWWCLLSVIFDKDWQMRDERRRRGASSIWHNPLVPAPIRDNNTSPQSPPTKTQSLVGNEARKRGPRGLSLLLGYLTLP